MPPATEGAKDVRQIDEILIRRSVRKAGNRHGVLEVVDVLLPCSL